MVRLLDCITLEHNQLFLLLAGAICVASMQVMFLLLRRVDECAPARQPMWLSVSALVGGLGIWSTHFVAMLAYRSAVPVAFDWLTTIFSALIAIVGVLEALRLLGSSLKLRALYAGLALAAAVAAMHFSGILAMHGLIRQDYDYPLLIAGAGVGIGCFSLGFFCKDYGRRWLRYVLPGLLVVVGILMMHFADMAAASYVIDASVSPIAIDDLSRTWMIGAVCAIAAISASVSVIAVFLDRYLTDLRGLTDAYLEGVAVVQGQRIIEVNARFRDIVEFEGPTLSLIGLNPETFLTTLDGLPLLVARDGTAEAVLASGASEKCLEIAVKTVEYRGRPSQVLAIRDLTATRQAHRQIEHLATHDPLTNLANRTRLQDRLDQAITEAKRSNAAVAVLALDLDRFKAVNDLYGHAAGDDVLKQVAAILCECTNDVDTIARIGGDEFIVVQVGQAQPKGADLLAIAIQKAFRRDFNPKINPKSVGVSIGVALYPDDGADGATLRHGADIALYRAKSSGRGTTAHYSAEMDQEVQTRRRIEGELRQAIRRRQLRLAFQPLVTAQAGTVVGYEALLRWHHPELGDVAPMDFIPVAEESGVILAVGDWVLRTACKAATQWPDALVVAVNVSAVQFSRPTFADRVFEVLAETGLDPARLELEITETVLLQDEALSRLTLSRLKATGVRIAVDDFGTGYSSLSSLRAFRFDKIKIDRSFIATMAEDGYARAIVRSIADLGRNINVPVLAEGVETKAQHDMIAADGCTHAQGYYFGRPQDHISDSPTNIVPIDVPLRRG